MPPAPRWRRLAYIFFSPADFFAGLYDPEMVMLLVTVAAPHFFAIRVTAPLLPGFLAVPVSVATPLLTEALNP